QGRRPLEKHWKDCIIGWHDDDKSYREIVELLAQQNIHTSRSTVARVLKKKFIPREYRPTSIKDMDLYASIRDTVIRCYLDDSQSTLQSVAATIKLEFNEEISVDVVRRIREESGFQCYNTRYGHSVRIVNRPLRLAFCREQIEKDNMFTAHVFTDECCVQLSANNRFVFCLRGDVQRRVKSVHKNPVKVMIWGGISWRGATPLVMFDTGSKINNGMYQAVLETAYKKWARFDYIGISRVNSEKRSENMSTSFKTTPPLILQQELWSTSRRNRSRRVQPQMRKVIENEGAPVHD
ncbi:hypothetical protein PENTCL1PPCAC_28652, partial [Pristionchus entomophagus]